MRAQFVEKMILKVQQDDEPEFRGLFAVGDPPPGTFSFRKSNDYTWLQYVCPCGQGHANEIPINSPTPSWSWDGNVEKPTITPSINHISGPCRWHGFLTAGEWISV